MFGCLTMTTPSHWSSKMSDINLVTHGNMIIFCNYRLNLTHFKTVCHKSKSQENFMGFQIKL